LWRQTFTIRTGIIKLEVLGIDIGGTGIKGATVDVTTGRLTNERHRISTPHNATPTAVAEIVHEIASHFNWAGPIGCTVPAVVEHGLVRSAANIHDMWIDTQVEDLFSSATGRNVTVLNDADAAGLASVKFGAGKGRDGVVFFLTIGTGIGSAILLDQKLVPNTELGHLILHNKAAELYTSDRVRKRKEMSWEKWAARFQEYLDRLEFLFSPDTIIIGGGISRPKKAEQYLHFLSTRAGLLTASLQNEAGLIGAAYAAAQAGDSHEG